MSGVLFVTRNFPPLVGGMERLAMQSVISLAAEWPLRLIGPIGCEAWAPAHVDVAGIHYRSVAGFLAQGWWKVIRSTGIGRFDAVVGGSGLAAPLIRGAARRTHGAGVCFVHGLDLVVDHPVYQSLCLPALRKMDLVIANSRNTARLAADVGISEAQIEILNPGVQPVDSAAAGPFLAAYPVAQGRPLLLSVGRLLPRKGIVEFVERVLPRVVETHPDLLLVVAGGPASDALVRDRGEGQRLAAAVARSGMSDHVLLTGVLGEPILASLYAAGSLMVFPVKDLPNDVEGFGMVALEAAAHGLPTVAFDAGGVSDAVREGVSGSLVPAGDHARMVEVIDAYLAGRVIDVTGESCRAFAREFAWDVYADRLRALFRRRVMTVTI